MMERAHTASEWLCCEEMWTVPSVTSPSSNVFRHMHWPPVHVWWSTFFFLLTTKSGLKDLGKKTMFYSKLRHYGFQGYMQSFLHHIRYSASTIQFGSSPAANIVRLFQHVTPLLQTNLFPFFLSLSLSLLLHLILTAIYQHVKHRFRCFSNKLFYLRRQIREPPCAVTLKTQKEWQIKLLEISPSPYAVFPL